MSRSSQQIGAPGGTRTRNVLLGRQILYLFELLTHENGLACGIRTRVAAVRGRGPWLLDEREAC